MFFKNVGQMIQLHTPKATRNQATRFEMTTPRVSGFRARGRVHPLSPRAIELTGLAGALAARR
jgi:hypothetical protein